MIARPHICLRCQSRLARRSGHLKTQLAFQSTDAKPQGSRIIQDDLEEKERLHAPIKRPLKLSRRPLGPAKQLSEYPLGKLYGYTGQQLRENRETLNVKVLGEAAEVIVLRDSRISKHSHQYEEDVETKEGIDILAKLDEERGLVGWKEVESNIHEFRPNKDRHPQTREEFSELLTGLQSGFTVSQLARYLQVHGQKNTAALPITTSLLRISPWIPGISESDQRLDSDQLRGYDLQSYTTKQRLVLRLLRECWKLELPFVEEGIGQIEVELKPEDLDLLLKGSSSPLSLIHSKHIVEREQRLESFRSNDANRSRNAIRITSTRTKSYLIVQEIEQTLKGIQRIQIPLKALIPQPKEGEQSDFWKLVNTQFDDSTVEELARLTNTDIRRMPGGSLFVASVLPNSNIASSTRPDIVRRLVLTSGNFSDREVNWVGCKEAPNATEGIFVKYPLSEGLAWRDRLRQWTRWVTPISKDGESNGNVAQVSEESGKPEYMLPLIPNDSKPQDKPENSKPESVSDASNEELQEIQSQKPEVKRPHVAFWSDELSVQSSALMGSVLYNQPQLPSTKASQGKPLFADAIRSFSTAVPGISRILTTSLASSTKPAESLIMRFLPNPFSHLSAKKSPIGSAVLSAFPPIEMRFAVDPTTKVTGLNFIRAILSTENSDLMLPDSPMDIRFQQKTTSRLYCTHRSLPPGIADFLNKSNLSLDFSHGGLITPPLLKIPIAAHLCSPGAFELLGLDKEHGEMQEVEYLFAGLEIRKTISMEFEGWRLLYTSVEAGKAGGRRSELRLRPARTVESDDPKMETEEAFLAAAYKLADASYTPLGVRRVTLENVRMVPTYKEKRTDSIFKYFARRPKITFEGKRSSTEVEDETGEELSEDNDKARMGYNNGRPAS